MGLINLLTNPKNFKFYTGGQGYTGNGNQPGLTNIPYGKDQVGGGSSGQPYIQIPIQQKTTNLGLANSDFILRGGALSVENAANDVLRLTKMFGDLKSPNGLLFIAKQQILSRTAVRTQTSNGALNEGAYNPLGTIAQAGIVNIGGHLNKQGNILGETGAYANNDALYGVKITPTQPTDDNRLVQLYNTKQIKENDFPDVLSYNGGPGSGLTGVGKTNIRFALGQRTGINNSLRLSNPSLWYGYFENPTSKERFPSKQIIPGQYLRNLSSTDQNASFIVYDQGVSGKYVRLLRNIDENSYINNYYNLEGKQVGTYDFNVYEPAVEGNTWPKNSPLINNNGTYTYNQEDIIAQTPIRGTYNTTQDFRARLRDNNLNPQSITTKDATISGQLTLAPSYNIGDNQTIEGRVNLGNPGNRANKSYASYYNGVIDKITNTSVYPTIAANSLGSVGSGKTQTRGTNKFNQLGLDKINSLPVYGAQSVDTSGITNDLVKFRIAVIDNDDPSLKTFIHFRALLDSISDSYNATWNPVQYLGRGESFYNYNSFTRQLSLSWTVAAQSKQELIPMYKKLNFLASSLAPDYSGNGYMRGNMVQLTIGGYLYEQPGIITGLTYTMEETSPWEIGIGTSYDAERGTVQGDSNVKELTHIIRVTGFTFIPIHRFRPEIQNFGDQEDYKRFIALENGADTNYTGGSTPVLPPEVITDIPQTPKKDPIVTDKQIITDIKNNLLPRTNPTFDPSVSTGIGIGGSAFPRLR
jgi:hypothetical protein